MYLFCIKNKLFYTWVHLNPILSISVSISIIKTNLVFRVNVCPLWQREPCGPHDIMWHHEVMMLPYGRWNLCKLWGESSRYHHKGIRECVVWVWRVSRGEKLNSPQERRPLGWIDSSKEHERSNKRAVSRHQTRATPSSFPHLASSSPQGEDHLVQVRKNLNNHNHNDHNNVKPLLNYMLHTAHRRSLDMTTSQSEVDCLWTQGNEIHQARNRINLRNLINRKGKNIVTLYLWLLT